MFVVGMFTVYVSDYLTYNQIKLDWVLFMIRLNLINPNESSL